MKKMIFISILAACAFAGNFEDGLKAYGSSNFKEALAKFEAGCAENDVKSCVKTGAIYQLGKTALPNPSKALEYYNKACEAGEVEGCSAAGGLYLNTEPQKARELVLRKSVLEVGSLPGKLADCTSKKAEECEIFIVEGDSAGGSAKQGRDRYNQAILPLRGKIINVEKAGLHKSLESSEIRAMVTAFGTSIGETFDISKLRYGKIILMTDADVDGAHIRTLILTFLYRYMIDLIYAGNVYIACPPLYKVSSGKQIVYAYNDLELKNVLGQMNQDNKKYTIQRYKGLGEMNPEQLWETTMNPDGRLLLKVSIDNAREADMLFDKLMGDKVEPRREFIEEHAEYVKNIDI